MHVSIEAGGYRLLRIEAEDVDSVLPAVLPLLARAVPHTEGFATLEQLVAQMRDGARPWQLWAAVGGTPPAVRGAFLTTLERVGPDTVCQYELLAGVEAQEWIGALIGRFESYLALMYGVTHTRIVGRRGWERFVARYGFRAQHFVTSKRLVRGALDARTQPERVDSGLPATLPHHPV